MIRYQFFPKSKGVTKDMSDVIECFEKAVQEEGEDTQVSSNEMLALIRPFLAKKSFKVATGKSASEKIRVPVLFGENSTVEKSYTSDAISCDGKIVIDLEPRQSVFNEQYMKDIFLSCLMCGVEYLVIAVLNDYYYNTNGKDSGAEDDYNKICNFLDTLYISNRLQLPLKGILLIGY